ncbi:MAG: hypothetical protein KAG89_16100 [Fulvimarina manganoxydans]|uniref:hypothetical protein n=1 Tax=Fulvimarina manganoxydans TaxID=937218 RepID=UPI002351F9B4|nr:hypothetical protein [Fulvimarina manganoxydans]MCK5933685.1 hypothetical protein [Fulvimarina manganoxydans]
MPGPCNCYFLAMIVIADLKMRRRLPTSEGFAKLSDRARLPGRFFYRLQSAHD